VSVTDQAPKGDSRTQKGREGAREQQGLFTDSHGVIIRQRGEETTRLASEDWRKDDAPNAESLAERPKTLGEVAAVIPRLAAAGAKERPFRVAVRQFLAQHHQFGGQVDDLVT
jgi:hypothetical protein